jgi:hypothetical protein
MAKLTRSAIKSIVKECLIEILQEGLMTDSSASFINESKKSHIRSNSAPKERKTREPVRRMGLDKIEFSSQNMSPNQNLDRNIREAANSMTSDPVLSSILEDTGKTTLQEQMVAEQKTGPGGNAIPTSMAGDRMARVAAMSNPEDLFGESASKWADLAFSAPVNRPQN